jgi:phosphopantothenoylcysteine decarboxylase/phosphopantothenate--cysteine ligase
MGGDRNTVHLLSREGADIEVESWPAMAKEQVAAALISEIVKTVGKSS